MAVDDPARPGAQHPGVGAAATGSRAAEAAPAGPGAGGASPAKPGVRDAMAALRHRNFAIFFAGALLSNTGTWVQGVTVPFVVFRLTGSAGWVGVAAFAQLLPMSLLSMVGGALSDRHHRRTILLVTQALAAVLALAMAALWASGRATAGSVIALVAVSGVVTGLNVPSWQAFVSELVPREALLNAVTLNSAQFNAARAFGPAIGGAVLGAWGPGWAFALNAASYVAVIVAVLAIRVPRLPKVRDGRMRLLAETTATARYVRHNRGMAAAFLAVTALGLFGSPIISLIVVFAEDVFSVEGFAYGALAGAIGLGSVLAAPVVAGAGARLARSRMAAGAMVVYGAALIAFSLSPVYLLGFAALLVAGMAYLPLAATLNTTLQLQVHETRRGKVLALYITLFTLTIPIGSLVQGWTTDLVGPRWTVGVAAALFVAAALALRASGLLPHLDDEHAEEPR